MNSIKRLYNYPPAAQYAQLSRDGEKIETFYRVMTNGELFFLSDSGDWKRSCHTLSELDNQLRGFPLVAIVTPPDYDPMAGYKRPDCSQNGKYFSIHSIWR